MTGLRGCFAYVHRADPKNHIWETNEGNNDSQRIVRLPWRGNARGCPWSRSRQDRILARRTRWTSIPPGGGGYQLAEGRATGGGEPRVCVIGAGSSGIASCQVLNARGIPFDCFEKGSGVGGNWRYMNDNGMSSAYRVAAHQHVAQPDGVRHATRCRTTIRTIPNHRQIAAYFDDYVDHFGFREHIRFNTEVTDASSRAERRLGRHASPTAPRTATTRCWWPTATTGMRAGPSRRSPASSAAARCTPTTTRRPRAWRTQRARARDRQLGDGHRGRDLARVAT